MGTDSEPQNTPEEYQFRNFVTFGTGEGAPPRSTVEDFRLHVLSLTAPVPTRLCKAFVMLDHDMSDGSDRLFIVDGLIGKAAAEIWAAHVILSGSLGPLTMYHHARALYEAHALAYWLLGDFATRWQRVLKETLRERLKFEEECKGSIGEIHTDVMEAGHQLIADPSVKNPPSIKDQIKGNPVLSFDYALFWKHSSAHIHPGHIGTDEIDYSSEKTALEQLIRGTVRHCAGVYRCIADAFDLAFETDDLLRKAEEYSRHQFDLSVDS